MIKWSEQKIYIYLALIFGIMFIFITPPFQSPDEDSHFKKAYLTSKGEIYPIVKNERSGNYLPKEMVDYISKKVQYIGDRYKKYTYSDFVNEQYGTMNYDKKTFNMYSTSQVLFIAYIPAALGIIVSKLFAIILGMHNVTVPYMLYFARLFSFITSIFIVYNAIKITPFLKKTMMAVALMPMSLYLMSMITYDSVIISLALFTVAYILRLIYDKSIKSVKKKDIIILSLLGFMMLNYKVVYSTLFILLLFVPKEKFKDIKGKIKDIIIIAISIILLSLLFKLPIMLLPHFVEGSEALVQKQIHFVTHHIGTFISIVISNIIGQRTTQIVGMVGTFGLLDTFLPLSVVFIYVIYLVMISLVDSVGTKKITGLMKLAIIVAVILSVFGIFGAMYVNWTPKIFGEIGTRDITGVQGRYFIPLLFPVLMLFSNSKIKGKLADVIKDNYLVVIVFTLLISQLMILLRFWV